MPDARLQRTREAYLCGRAMMLAPWLHCSCRDCTFARHTAMNWTAIVEFGAHNYATDFSGMGVSDAVDVRLPSMAPRWRAPHENAAEHIADRNAK